MASRHPAAAAQRPTSLRVSVDSVLTYIVLFMGVLLTGVIAGAYSSLMLAPNILVAAEKGELPKLRIPFRSRRAATA